MSESQEVMQVESEVSAIEPEADTYLRVRERGVVDPDPRRRGVHRRPPARLHCGHRPPPPRR